jgi:hypothetical protein
MNRVIRDGLVAVLVSPGFGAGWSTWNTEYEELLFDPGIVELVEQKKWQELETYVTLKYPGIYRGGMPNLEIQWIPQGAEFVIDEYDGAESLKLKDDIIWYRA